jgi:hypothetical protein
MRLSECEGTLISDYQYPYFRLPAPAAMRGGGRCNPPSASEVPTVASAAHSAAQQCSRPTADAGTWRGDRPPRVADAAALALGRQRRLLLLHRRRGFGGASRGRSGARTKRVCARCASCAGRQVYVGIGGPALWSVAKWDWGRAKWDRGRAKWDWCTLQGAAGPLLLLVLGSGSGSGRRRTAGPGADVAAAVAAAGSGLGLGTGACENIASEGGRMP